MVTGGGGSTYTFGPRHHGKGGKRSRRRERQQQEQQRQREAEEEDSSDLSDDTDEEGDSNNRLVTHDVPHPSDDERLTRSLGLLSR